MEHVRSDEGMKRGAKRRGSPLRRSIETGLAEAIPSGLDPKTVLEAYLSYPHTSQIAAKFGVRRSSLTAWLRVTAPEDWKNVQRVRAHLRKEDGDEAIENSLDAFELARAREMLRSGQWDLERLDADYAQQKAAININADGPVTVQVVSFAAQLPQCTTPHNEHDTTQALENKEV